MVHVGCLKHTLLFHVHAFSIRSGQLHVPVCILQSGRPVIDFLGRSSLHRSTSFEICHCQIMSNLIKSSPPRSPFGLQTCNSTTIAMAPTVTVAEMKLYVCVCMCVCVCLCVCVCAIVCLLLICHNRDMGKPFAPFVTMLKGL